MLNLRPKKRYQESKTDELQQVEKGVKTQLQNEFIVPETVQEVPENQDLLNNDHLYLRVEQQVKFS